MINAKNESDNAPLAFAVNICVCAIKYSANTTIYLIKKEHRSLLLSLFQIISRMSKWHGVDLYAVNNKRLFDTQVYWYWCWCWY